MDNGVRHWSTPVLYSPSFHYAEYYTEHIDEVTVNLLPHLRDEFDERERAR